MRLCDRQTVRLCFQNDMKVTSDNCLKMVLQLKKDTDLEKAGLQFISYQELQATLQDQPSDPASHAADAEEEAGGEGKMDKMEGESRVEGGCEAQEKEEEETSRLVENIKISDPRRGTEVKLLGLRLGENTATVSAQQITVCLQCNR